jgi:phytol kinase
VAPSHLALSGSPLSLQREFVRKSLHLAAAVFPVAYSLGVDRAALVWVLAATSIIALLVEWLRRSNMTFAAAFARTAGTLTRPTERESMTGATWLALSCLFAVAVLSRQAAIAALWCATVGDPAATIAGRLWTMRHKARDPQPGRKTVAGSLACASISFAGAWLLGGYVPVLAVAIAAVATIAEGMPVRIDDNIRVIAASGAIAQLLT